MRETATDLEALQALLTESIERASPFLRSSFQTPQRSLTIIDERDPDFAQLDAVQVECGGESPRQWQGHGVYLRLDADSLDADSLVTYASDSAR
jgi:hypothetical protein